MFTIGDFARHGRVSVRMLRHYDAIGLLTPAETDPFSGYRRYEVGQLARLNRIVALKELGFGLDQVAELLDERINAERMRGMLTLRRAELRSALAADTTRLAAVEARLRTIEGEEDMSSYEITVRTVPAVRLLGLQGRATSFSPEHIGPVVQPLCAELGRRLATTSVEPEGPLTCYYEEGPDDSVIVHAAVPVPGDTSAQAGLEVTELPAIEAATTVHRGSMDQVLPAWQQLASYAEAHGGSGSGPTREVYRELSENSDDWVTELVEPLAPTAG